MKSDSKLHRLLRAAAAALAILAGPSAVSAQGIFGAADAPPAVARLVAGWAEPGGARVAGLVVELAPGWKTYWRRPGEAGIPPQFDWSGSGNLRRVAVAWPSPIVFETFGMRTIGYAGRMTLPLRIEHEDPAQPVRLRLALFYGVCEDVCIPARADLALDIAPGAPEAEAGLLRAALDEEPRREEGAAVRCRLKPEAERIEARIALQPSPTTAPVVVAEGQEGLWLGPMEAALEGGAILAAGEMRADPGLWIDRAAIRFTIIGAGGATFVDGCPAG